MRVAFASPLPPTASGIADYSARLIPLLTAGGLALDVYHDGAEPKGLPFPTQPVAELQPPGAGARHDVVLYQIGNDPRFHAKIYETALRIPGVVVLHETMLHHMVRQLALDTGGPAAYRREMEFAYGASGRVLGHGFTELGVTEGLWRFPLFERLADRSLGLIVHSRTAARRVWLSRPEARVEVVPHLAPLAPLEPAEDRRQAAREVKRRYGCPEDAFLVGCFGFLTAQKRLPVLLSAFRTLRRELAAVGRSARLLLVGAAAGEIDLSALLAQDKDVIHTGRVPEAELEAAMAAVDVAVNLRHPNGGETSGTLIRLLELARPVIVTNEGSFAEVPDGCCAKVDHDDDEEGTLTAYLRALAADPDLGRRLGENGRRYLEEYAAPERVVTGYRRALEAALQAPPPPQELPPPRRGEMARRLHHAVGADLADLGVRESDPAVAAVAATVAEVLPPQRS